MKGVCNYREDPLYSCNLAQLATLQASKGDLDCQIVDDEKSCANQPLDQTIFPYKILFLVYYATYEVPLKNNIFSLTVFQYDWHYSIKIILKKNRLIKDYL